VAPGSLCAVRLRWFLTMTTILAATVVLTVVVSDRLDAGGDGGDQVVGGADGTDDPGPSSSTTTEPPSVQAQVTGTITAMHLEGAVLDPRELATPFIVVSDRGFGNGGEISGVRVDGSPASIVWDGGRPFVLSSGGAMRLDPVVADLPPEGLRLALGGTTHRFTPGTYQLDTPVAVGTSGVAGARDAVTFEADASSSFEGSGDAALFLDASQPRHLLGPGTVHLEGSLQIVDARGTRTVGVIDATAGAFDITLTPLPDGGWTITATLQGETTER
jgi:hypothetical protein